MLNWIRHLLYKFITKGDDVMMAMLFAQRVILGKTKFEEVPRTLKQQVADILVESGLGELVTEEEYLPKEEIDPDFSVNPEEVPAE